MENSNPKYLYDNPDLARQEDPWLSGFILAARTNSDPAKLWNQLILRSTHVNKLVTLASPGKIGRWGLDLDVARQYLSKGTLIVNMSADPFNKLEEQVVDQLSTITDNFVVLSGDATYFIEPKDHICFLPFWYLIQKYIWPKSIASSGPCSYKISSLNGTTRYHRVENFVKLKEKTYFDQLYFTMRYAWNERTEKQQTPKSFWNSDIAEKFSSLILPDQSPGEKTDSIDNPAYQDSYVNYVTETSILDGTIMTTEKTWKPIMAGQPAIWLANPGTVNFLRSIGFDMFDDILDDHRYDNETNLNRRIDMIYDIIDNIMSADLAQIFQDTLARRQANLDQFYSDDLETVLTRQCQNYRAIINL